MLNIDVISDVICPWCFIGKRRLEKALDGRPATVRWHPFQLNPDMPREGIVKLRLTRPWFSRFPEEMVRLGHHG
jgi:predicted DsbA family dithiol-disulfide isomerase